MDFFKVTPIKKSKTKYKPAFSFKPSKPKPYVNWNQPKVKKKQMNFGQAIARYPKLNPYGDGDADRDGVMNYFDCKPFDKYKQGFGHLHTKRCVTCGKMFTEDTLSGHSSCNEYNVKRMSLIDKPHFKKKISPKYHEHIMNKYPQLKTQLKDVTVYYNKGLRKGDPAGQVDANKIINPGPNELWISPHQDRQEIERTILHEAKHIEQLNKVKVPFQMLNQDMVDAFEMEATQAEREVEKHPFNDFDKDGVINSEDCEPYNINKQGLIHELNKANQGGNVDRIEFKKQYRHHAEVRDAWDNNRHIGDKYYLMDEPMDLTKDLPISHGASYLSLREMYKDFPEEKIGLERESLEITEEDRAKD
jgi:hypothetical protein